MTTATEWTCGQCHGETVVESADIQRCEPCDCRYRMVDAYVAELIDEAAGETL
jgi:hypothetical protein